MRFFNLLSKFVNCSRNAFEDIFFRMAVFSRLARVRGSAFEACLKALAVGEYHNVELVRPTSIFVGQRERIFDPSVMAFVWEVAQKVKRRLAKLGFKVVLLNIRITAGSQKPAFLWI